MAKAYGPKIHPQLTVMFPWEVMELLERYAKEHKVPMGRAVRRIMSAAPWFDCDSTQVVLNFPKSLRDDPDALREAMLEAVDLAIKRLSEDS